MGAEKGVFAEGEALRQQVLAEVLTEEGAFFSGVHDRVSLRPAVPADSAFGSGVTPVCPTSRGQTGCGAFRLRRRGYRRRQAQ